MQAQSARDRQARGPGELPTLARLAAHHQPADRTHQGRPTLSDCQTILGKDCSVCITNGVFSENATSVTRSVGVGRILFLFLISGRKPELEPKSFCPFLACTEVLREPMETERARQNIC